MGEPIQTAEQVREAAAKIADAPRRHGDASKGNQIRALPLAQPAALPSAPAVAQDVATMVAENLNRDEDARRLFAGVLPEADLPTIHRRNADMLTALAVDRDRLARELAEVTAELTLSKPLYSRQKLEDALKLAKKYIGGIYLDHRANGIKNAVVREALKDLK